VVGENVNTGIERKVLCGAGHINWRSALKSAAVFAASDPLASSTIKLTVTGPSVESSDAGRPVPQRSPTVETCSSSPPRCKPCERSQRAWRIRSGDDSWSARLADGAIVNHTRAGRGGESD